MVGEALLPAMVALFLAAFLLLRRRYTRKLPPSPRGLPVLGHMHLLGRLPHQTLHSWNKIYGPLMSLRLGSVTAVVAGSPEAAKLILNTHDNIFSGRPPATIYRHFPSFILAQPGPLLTFMKQLATSLLMSSMQLAVLSSQRLEETQALLRVILHLQQSPFVLRPFLRATSNNIISRMILSDRMLDFGTASPSLTSTSAPSSPLLTLTLEWIHLFGTPNLGDFIPWLLWLDLGGYDKRCKALWRETIPLLQEVIDKRRASRDPVSTSPPKDYLDGLLQASADEKNKHLQLTDKDIAATLLTVFAGGTDTSSLALEWALAELLANPQKMKTLQEELIAVVGTSRLVQQSDIPHLPYLQAVAKETLRLHPVAPLLVPHFSNQPCQLMGFEIPANTMALVNVWGIGRDPNVWGHNALEFHPERMLDGKMDVRGHHFELLPFGSGRRMCSGLRFGMMNVQLLLGNLVHCFDWVVEDKIDFEEMMDIVLTLKNPLVVKVVPRLSPSILEL